MNHNKLMGNEEVPDKTKNKKVNQSNKHSYSTPWRGSDATICVELDDKANETFHVHSSIMSSSSPVFKEMLNSKKEDDSTVKKIKMPGKDPTVVLQMLNLVYPTTYRLNEISSCEKLLELATEYDIIRVFTAVDEYLAADATVCQPKFLLLAEKFHLEKTRSKHMSHFISVTDLCPQMSGSKIWLKISSETKLEILLTKARGMFVDGQPECTENDCSSEISDNNQQQFRKVVKTAYKATQQAANQLTSEVDKSAYLIEHLSSDGDGSDYYDHYNDYDDYDGCDYSGYST